MQKVVIFDLDGTLALNTHRQHFIRGKYPNWDKFNLACGEDIPHWPTIETLRLFDASPRYQVAILSGRSDIARRQTESWLTHLDLGHIPLYMRPRNDNRPDEILKWEMLTTYFELKNVLCIFDDRQKVVDMWRAKGLVCFQVAEGDF